MARAVTASRVVTLPATGERHRLDLHDRGATIVRLADDAPVGTIVFDTSESAELAIRCIEVDEPERGYGAGSEAIRLLLAASSGYDTATAMAPPDQGLPVYFWSRMGFRPHFGAQPDGGITFTRDFAQ
jgi:hypothetical protein